MFLVGYVKAQYSQVNGKMKLTLHDNIRKRLLGPEKLHAFGF